MWITFVTMKKYFIRIKEFATKSPALAVFILVLLGALSTQIYTNWKMLGEVRSIVPRTDSTMQVMTKQWKGKDNKQYVQYIVKEVTNSELSKMQSAELASLRAQLKEAKIKEKNLQSAVMFSTTTRDTIVVPINDTIQTSKEFVASKYFNWADSFLSITGAVVLSGDSSRVILNKLDIAYQLEERFSVIHAYKRSGLFQPKELTLTIVSDNPKTVVGKVQTYTIKPPKKKFYQTTVFKTLVGVGIGSVVGYKLAN